MTILVAVASKHGATRVIGGVIADTLNAAGIPATVTEAASVGDVTGYDAVVLGSAVYAGHWLPEARELVDRQSGPLGERPVWLFSSGPLGEPAKPEGDSVDVSALVERTGARGHRVFGGRLDFSKLRFGERAMCIALRVPEGDFRPWGQIRAWTRGIAAAMGAGAEGGWERPPAQAALRDGTHPRHRGAGQRPHASRG